MTKSTAIKGLRGQIEGSPVDGKDGGETGLRSLYLRQMVRDLTRFDGTDDFIPFEPAATRGTTRRLLGRAIISALRHKNLEVVRRVRFDSEKRMLGRDWPVNADTMIGVKRLQNVCHCVQKVIEEGIPGDLVETGVWRGGASIMMRAALEANGDKERRVWCADSFEGLPTPDLERYPQDKGMIWHTQSVLAVSLDQVRSNFEKYGLLDDRVVFLKGWFKDTLPGAPIKSVSVLRLDGDLYASTMDALRALYPRVSPGGFVIVDDYGIPEDTCRRAVNDFRASQGISVPIQDIDGWGIFWRR
jgi:O-methyltransferase